MLLAMSLALRRMVEVDGRLKSIAYIFSHPNHITTESYFYYIFFTPIIYNKIQFCCTRIMFLPQGYFGN